MSIKIWSQKQLLFKTKYLNNVLDVKKVQIIAVVHAYVH